jgi:hypothetical protein
MMTAGSCGTANVNKLFGTKDESYAGLLRQAQFAYDSGDFSLAEELANKAYSRSENNGDAGVLLGSIYLSQAGIDIFQLVSKLSTLSSSSSSGSSSSDTCKSSSTNQSAGNLLSELSCKLLSLSESDKDALGTNQTFSGLTLIGVPSVYIPNEVTDTLRAKVSVLSALDKGIRKLCPFINRASVLSQSVDERHTSAALCPDQTSTSFNSPRAHISFALLHLVEALVFQQGVLVDGVSTATSSRTGVSGISSKITTNATDVTKLAAASVDFATVLGKVFDTDNTKSQITLALNGLIMVSQSFEVAGVPSSVTSVITSQLTKLKQTASAIPGGDTDSAKQSKALSGQINEAYAKSLAQKINSTCGPTGANCSSDQKKDLCKSYSTITEGMDSTKKPTLTITCT